MDELYIIREKNDTDKFEFIATIESKLRIRYGKRYAPSLVAYEDVTDLYYGDNNADQWG